MLPGSVLAVPDTTTRNRKNQTRSEIPEIRKRHPPKKPTKEFLCLVEMPAVTASSAPGCHRLK